MDIRRLTYHDGDAWTQLLAVSFDRQMPEMVALWQWLHTDRELIGWGAWDGPRLAAQYTSLLTALHLPGAASSVRVGLSVNMAVHPDYRGRGLIKQIAAPVYQALSALGGVAGVGFSNAAGVRVDRHSKSYGYHVVGKLVSRCLWLLGRPALPLRLTESWPTAAWHAASCDDGYIRFDPSPAVIRHRFGAHPFRRYRFGVWEKAGQIQGLVVDRPIVWGKLPGAALLAAYALDLPGLLASWAAAIRRTGARFVHSLTTPASRLYTALKPLGLGFSLPYSRSPYYLTVKPLQAALSELLLNFKRWDCVGGDIL